VLQVTLEVVVVEVRVVDYGRQYDVDGEALQKLTGEV